MGPSKKEEPIDVVAVCLRKPKPETLLDVEEGMLDIWCSSDTGEWIHLNIEEHSFFCDSKSYVCHFIYHEKKSNRLRSKVYFW